jgi:hypothetical protein
VFLEGSLRDALVRLTRNLPADSLQEAFRRPPRWDGADPVARNQAVPRLLIQLNYCPASNWINDAGPLRFASVREVVLEDLEAGDRIDVQSFIGCFGRYGESASAKG